jgi:hypothetical protein
MDVSKDLAIHRLDITQLLLCLSCTFLASGIKTVQSSSATGAKTHCNPINLFHFQTSSLTLFYCCELGVTCHHGGCSGDFQ